MTEKYLGNSDEVKDLLVYVHYSREDENFANSLRYAFSGQINAKKRFKIDISLTEDSYFNYLQKNKYSLVILEFFPSHDEDDFDWDFQEIKKMIARAKERGCKVMGSDGSRYSYYFMKAGCDYYGINDWGNINLIERIIMFREIIEEGKIPGAYADLIIEKKEFYNSVKSIFDERSRITADKKKELKFILSWLRHANCKYILDAGCGNGRLSESLAAEGYVVTGVDINENLINDAIKKRINPENPDYIVSDLIYNNLKESRFDAVLLMWHVICEFRFKSDDLLAKMSRMLKQGGILILDFPDVQNNLKISDEGVYEDNGLGLKKYVGLVPNIQAILTRLEYLGFKVVYWKRFKWGIRKFVVVAKKM